MYHGSPHKFDIAEPNKTVRFRWKDGKQIIKYSGVSLHVTPCKWIALSYIGTRATFIKNGKRKRFLVGVSLYNNDHVVSIFGKKNLEYSLKKIYGKGGYLYTFDTKHFTNVPGLGPLESISLTSQKPSKREFIKNPVKKMKELGVTFEFKEL